MAAHNVGRLSRALAGCAGVLIAAAGTLALLRWPGYRWLDAALIPTGLALVVRELVAELHERREFAATLLRSVAEATTDKFTDRKRAEEALGEHAAQLERGNDALRQANARLEATLVFKNDLTSMLTHDVNQPISSIAIFSQLLASDWADLPDHIRLDMATKIDKNTRRLIKMMSDLQLLFRLDTGSVTARRTRVPLLEVVERVTADSADEVEIHIGEDVTVLADREHLTAVVQNLVKNAFAYGGAPVQIRAHLGADGVELTITDHGAGIPEDLVPDLFGRFMRGAGLGLFIVRHLVEANGGTVRYEPAEPCGARLVVTLESASVPA